VRVFWALSRIISGRRMSVVTMMREPSAKRTVRRRNRTKSRPERRRRIIGKMIKARSEVMLHTAMVIRFALALRHLSGGLSA